MHHQVSAAALLGCLLCVAKDEGDLAIAWLVSLVTSMGLPPKEWVSDTVFEMPALVCLYPAKGTPLSTH